MKEERPGGKKRVNRARHGIKRMKKEQRELLKLFKKWGTYCGNR